MFRDNKMKKNLNLVKIIRLMLFLLPAIYIIFGWCIGLNCGYKPVVFGPYPDIPVAVRTGLLGSPLENISGSKAIMTVASLSEAEKGNTGDVSYFKREGYFEVPGTWKFVSLNYQRMFTLAGKYSRAICHDLNGRSLGSLSVEDLNDFLMRTGRLKDAEKLKPYLALARLERRYPYLYSETVLLSTAMGNIFKDNMIPYDVLGLVGIVVLFIALSLRSFSLWLYYLCWVFSYWFGRIGYHNPILVFTTEGRQVILWSFWHGFIVKEGRLFLAIILELSVIVFGMLAIMNMFKKIRKGKSHDYV